MAPEYYKLISQCLLDQFCSTVSSSEVYLHHLGLLLAEMLDFAAASFQKIN